MGICSGRLAPTNRDPSEVTPIIPWRKSRYQSEQTTALAGPIKLRSLLRDPDAARNAASAIKYKEKAVDWISEHYRTRLSVHKGEYKLEAALAATIVADFCEVGWKAVMYEYKLHRWDGDLVFVKDEEEEQPLVLVVEAKVLTGVYHDKTKFAKVIQQASTYKSLARSLFHQNCKVFSVAVVNVRLHGKFDKFKDTLFIAKRQNTRIPEELTDLLPVEGFLDSLESLHQLVPVLKDYKPPPKEDKKPKKASNRETKTRARSKAKQDKEPLE